MQVWAEEAPARAGGEFAEEITNRMPVSIQWSGVRQVVLTKEELCRKQQ